jgi:hypothetical protein
MNRPFGKYLFSLCILLLSVYCFTHAYPSEKDSRFSVATFETSLIHYLHHKPAARPQISAQLSHISGDWFSVYTEKNEEESFGLSYARTYIVVGNYFTRFFCSAANVNFHNVCKRLPNCAHWFLGSTHKYRILCVFRI